MKKMLSIKKIFSVGMVIAILASFTVSLNANDNGWIWPVTNASKVEISHPFKCNCGHPYIHNGVDIKAEKGAIILAVKEGTVSSVFTECIGSHLEGSDCSCEQSYGNHVIIDHGNNVYTLYAHMKNVDVSAGTIVKKGQNLGTVGNTGDSLGEHLHFEVRTGGVPVNPELSDYLGNAHVHQFNNGTCTSCSANLGDVNSDGRVNTKDSLMLKKYFTDNSVAINMQLADINQDGFVNTKDSYILKLIMAGSYNW